MPILAAYGVSARAHRLEPTVHATKTGKKYHGAGCRYLRRSDRVMKLSEAKKEGLTACSKRSPG